MRISDWSSDVCSSDLRVHPWLVGREEDVGGRSGDDLPRQRRGPREGEDGARMPLRRPGGGGGGQRFLQADRKSVVQGKRVSVRVDLGGRRILKTTHNNQIHTPLTSALATPTRH